MAHARPKHYGRHVHRLNEFFRINYEVILKRLHLNYGNYILLMFIYDNQDATQYSIAKYTGFSIQRTHQLINTLLDMELVLKIEDPSSQKKYLKLTDQGEQLVCDTENKLRSIYDRIFVQDAEVVENMIAAVTKFNEFTENLNLDWIKDE